MAGENRAAPGTGRPSPGGGGPGGVSGYQRLAELLEKLVATDAALAARLARLGAAVVPYRDEGSDSDPRPVPDVGRYRDVLRLPPGPGVEDWLLSRWRRRRAWWGVLLGPPSGHLVMVDLDSGELAEAWAKDRAGWERAASALASELSRMFPGACIVSTRRGAHVLFRVTPEEWRRLASTLKGNRRIGKTRLLDKWFDVDVVVLGATPLRSRKHRPATCPGLPLISMDGVLSRLGVELPGGGGGSGGSGDVEELSPEPTRVLSDSAVSEAASLLKQHWVPGHRHRLALGLAGLLAKAGFSEDSARRLVERIARDAGDEELEDRLRAVSDTYRKLRSGRLDEVAGKTLLVDELGEVTGSRDEALRLVEALEAALGARAPSSVLMSMIRNTGSRRVYAANDPLRGIVLVTVKGGEVVASHVVSSWYVDKVTVVKSDEAYETYRVVFKRAGSGDSYTDTGDVEELAARLRRLAGVKARTLLADALSAVIDEMRRRGAAGVAEVAGGPGIYPGGRLVRAGLHAELLTPPEPDKELARRALELLAELRRFYRDPSKFDAAILWAGYAPASYSYKEAYGVKQVYLLLHGERQTGKTTLARIIAAMYPLRTELGGVPEEGQTEYRLAWKLNLATVPVVEDEVQGISGKRTLLGLLKRAATGTLVRWRGDTGRAYRARAPLVMTSNYREVIEDDALRERILSIEFTARDRPDRSGVREFRRLLAEYRRTAPHLGAAVLSAASRAWDELSSVYRSVYDPVDALEAGREVWRLVARELGAEPPWLSLDPSSVDPQEPELGDEELVLTVVKEAIVEAMSRARLEAPADASSEELARALAGRGLLPSWMHPTRGGLLVTAVLARLLERRYGAQLVGGLKGLAERLGWPYRSTTVRGRRVKGMQIPWSVLDSVFFPTSD